MSDLFVMKRACRQALYDKRTQLISQLFQRLAAGHAASDVGTEASVNENGLAQVISIRKGLLLVVRLMPLLNQVTSRLVVHYMTRHQQTLFYLYSLTVYVVGFVTERAAVCKKSCTFHHCRVFASELINPVWAAEL